MPLVFQYGSNTSVERLNCPKRLDGAAKAVGVAFTKDDYEFDFTVYSGTNDCAAADLVPGRGRKIWGVIYDIPEERIYREKCPKNINCLDRIEGEGINYERKPIKVCWADGVKVEEPVLTYLVRKRSFDIQTNEEYVKHILKGLASHPIPNEYIEYVQSRILVNNPDLKGRI